MKNLETYLDKLISENHDEIYQWIKSKYNFAPAFYSSVDIRYSESKIAPVDTNLFPAGFNNLSFEAIKEASVLAGNYITQLNHDYQKILIIPESHTRNIGYLENIKIIHRIIKNAGYEVAIGTLDADLENFCLDANQNLFYQLIEKDGDIIKTENFTPDCIIVNNDMTSGRLEQLANIDQHILPALGMGWYRREKITNLRAYDDIIQDFANEFNIPKALISTEFGFCKNINFKEKKGLDCVANEVEKVLYKIRNNYQKLDIKDKPYVFIKANRGTYGMGIMMVESGDQIYDINKKERNKMSIIKNNTNNAEIIVQEGIKTVIKLDNKPSEAFTYQIGGNTAGTIYRMNQDRNEFSNLNSKGVEFKPMTKSSLGKFDSYYNLIASLSTLAATNEHDYYD
jgi:glutamate--cysteine ligase